KEYNSFCTVHEECLGEPVINCDSCIRDFWCKVNLIEALTLKCDCDNDIMYAKHCDNCYLDLKNYLIPAFPACICHEGRTINDDEGDSYFYCEPDCTLRLEDLLVKWYFTYKEKECYGYTPYLHIWRTKGN